MMLQKNDYIKSKSIYSIKKNHAKTNAGTIYENDYITIINNDGIYDDEMSLFSESNFKFKIKDNENNKKYHTRSNFIGGGKDGYWTKEDLKIETISDEGKIVFKPNYNSLKDFAYYGSAVELIKSTVQDIMLRFPGCICYYDELYAPKITVDDEDYLLLSNECQIDFWTKKKYAVSGTYVTNAELSGEVETLTDNIASAISIDIDEVKNPLRVLSLSYDDYSLVEPPKINITGSCYNSIIGTVVFNLGNDNNIELYIYKNENGDLQLASKSEDYKYNTILISPKEKFINEFWDTLDDFERVLLKKEEDDKKTVFTAIFETPYKDETGYYSLPKKYSWPVLKLDKKGFQDPQGSQGNQGPQGLHRNDVLDFTTSKFNMYINSLIELAQFHDEYDSDNIWRMMTHESIKNLDWTYNNEEIEDIDNSRMKSLIHIQGRLYDDVKRYIDNIKYTNTLSYDQKNNNPDYFLSDTAENEGWEAKSISTETNANSTFLRCLNLNSNYIQSMKGTRKGIVALLGMFGYIEDKDYSLTEYVARIDSKDFPKYADASCLRSNFDYVNGDEETNFMKGYPVAIVDFGETKEDEYGDTYNILRIVPWYDPDEKYEDNFYFQSKGGWGRTNEVTVKPLHEDDKETFTISGKTLYKETEPYMLFINNLDDLTSLPNNKVYEDMVCYVSDITDYDKKYNFKTGEKEVKPSHYFILRNKVLSTKLGYISGSTYNCYGWYNIKYREFKSKRLTSDGKIVLYLESLVANYKNNNPHTGKGNYDFGLDYLNKYTYLFRDAIDSGKCKNIDETTVNEIKEFGFGAISSVKDNNKCEEYVSGEDDKESYRIINIKNLSIKFYTNGNTDFKNYIKETVLLYLEPMIPSSTIFEILFDDEEETILKTIE